jgi:DNA invertase Pin-like site-specific DNA recombinase
MTAFAQKVQKEHLNREAIIYIRQSTIAQVRFNRESTERQYALQEKALSLGWHSSQIRIIDGDLGISGSGRTKRQGFQQLVTNVSMGEVGAVFGLEISRLARSSADLMKLLELCGLFHTIVVDEDGIYDMGDFNDRLVLGLKGTMGEAELHILKSRMLGGKENKASKGELRFPLPVGYIYNYDKTIILDSDEEVRNSVETIFRIFRSTGSAYGVVKYFAENHLLYPKRAYGGAWDGKLAWATLTHSRVIALLHNPSYAGAYVYGRYHDRKEVNQEGHFIHHTVCLPKEEWKVFIPNHHASYISWSEYEDNQKRLNLNRTNLEVSGSAREGAALLQGIILCGRCGRRMTVRYTGNGGNTPLYECIGRWEHGNKSTCTSVSARIIDQAVSERILAILVPSELELAIKVIDTLSDLENESDRTWKLALERASYDTKRAERQYQLAEPENRLVVRTLESNWNQKLQEFSRIEKEYAVHCSKKVWNPTSSECNSIRKLAEDIPALWNSSSTSIKDRKRIVRILIDDITVIAEPKKESFSIGIRYRSGHTEKVFLSKPLPRHQVIQHKSSTIERIRSLANSLNDSEIAIHLNTNGLRTPEGKEFTTASIKWIRYKHKIPNLYENSHNGLSVKEAADFFNVSTGIIYYHIKNGTIPARKQYPGWPWEIAINEANEKELMELLH